MIGNRVSGHGPIPCRVAVVGEGPGRVESETGLPFQGASGADLDYVFLRRAAKLRREDIYVTNIVKFRTSEDDRDPTPEEIKRDEEELLAEIAVCDPEIIVAVGKVAAKWFMEQEEIDLEKLHGTPIQCPRYPDKVLICCFHPAAGLHLPEKYYHLIYWDFEQLGRLVRGEIGPLDKPMATHYSDGGPDSTLFAMVPTEVSVDTEGSVAAPWGLSIAAEEGAALVLRGAEDSPAKDRLRKILGAGRVVMHNALHDFSVLEALGTPVLPTQVIDTMLAAYLLPQLPRRLKALSYKLCGIEQEEYEDVTKEAEEKVSEEYLQKVLDNECSACSGKGEISVPYKRDPSKFRAQRCLSCKGDGTGWPQPEAKLLFDDDSSGRVYTPRSVGKRVRELLKCGTRLREGWSQIDHSLRTPVEDKLGGMREVTLDDVPLERAIHYSAADADCTLRVWHKLEPLLKKEGLWQVYEIDKGILPIIHRMHQVGILIDREHFSRLDVQFSSEQSALVDRLSALGGKYINPSSPLQTAELIYDKLKCRPLRGKRSTDEKTLETLKIKAKGNTQLAEAIDIITDYRELDKLLGTYVRPLPLAADSMGRVHTQFLLHVTATGRLASRNPNLQNQPTRTERGRLIRRGFIPRDGCRLISVDLDQIELRVAAHMSGDEEMINVFATGRDIHRATAGLIYGKRSEEVTAQERLLAKTINFLILYGGGPGKLYSELSLLGIQTTKDQCVDYINGWFKAYPSVRDYITECHNKAKALGYVECLFGRRRYVQGVYSCIDKVREESLKWATNFPIQATSAALLKIWMKAVWQNVIPAIQRQGYCEPLLPVHDELILEVEGGLEDKLIQMVIQEAAQSIALAVPIKAKGKSAMSWDLLKD